MGDRGNIEKCTSVLAIVFHNIIITTTTIGIISKSKIISRTQTRVAAFFLGLSPGRPGEPPGRPQARCLFDLFVIIA